MATVERLLTAAQIRIAVVDPADRDAEYCLREYFAELDRRFDTGFDPTQSRPADRDEMRAPAGVFLVATLNDEPVGSGALKFHGDGWVELKRMWVRRPRGDSASDGACSPSWRPERLRTAARLSGSTRTRRSPKRSRCTAPRDTGKSTRSTTSATPTTGSRKNSEPTRARDGYREYCVDKSHDDDVLEPLPVYEDGVPVPRHRSALDAASEPAGTGRSASELRPVAPATNRCPATFTRLAELHPALLADLPNWWASAR